MEQIKSFFSKAIKAWLIIAIFGVSAGFGVLGVVVWEVFYGDFSHLEKSTIMAKIKEETTLFYLDEKTRIGSIFESRHRKYIPIDEMPAHVINAIVAAEDKNFYEHFGIDPIAIAKAAAEGLLNGGRFKRGASTITQQTVKNIVDDWDASFSRKFREMIRSLQLERIYNKRQILEFYLNQFHVAGNGNGIGIAARYYFNKDVLDLNLVEAAFIAGSVKAPSKYNPFIKYSKAARERAIEHANIRKDYVLKRMFEQGWISDEDYEEGQTTSIPFNKGEFRTAEVALVDLVKRQLKKPEVLDSLGLKNVTDLNIAGLKVYTTLDADLQREAQLAMRKNLSRLETILSGFKQENEEEYRPLRNISKNQFVYGKVVEVNDKNPQNTYVKLSFGIPTGVIPHKSLERYAKLLNLAVDKGPNFYLSQIVKLIKEGDILFTQVIDYDKSLNEAILELQKRPDISGGMITIDKGEVRAVVSGFDTLGFNRAMHAKRQPGSLFKALIFFASLQLGWNVMDNINNGRQIFPYQGKFYFPRPDHASPYDQVSMMWTGIMSENLASVALTYKLLDKVNYDEFKRLLEKFDLLPYENESKRDFNYRISREIGVSLSLDGIKAHQLQLAIEELAPDLIFSADQEILNKLKLMWWGQGYLKESENIRQLEPEDYSDREIKIRLGLLTNNFLRLEALAKNLREDWQTIEAAVQELGIENAFYEPSITEVFQRFRVLPGVDQSPLLGYNPILPEEIELAIVNKRPLIQQTGRALNILDIEAIWGKENLYGLQGNAQINIEQVNLANFINLQTFEQIAQLVEHKTDKVLADDDPYLLARYYNHRDFRLGLGLYYVIQLAKAAGIYNPLEPVLSISLGSADVTASEIAKLYQTFISGKTYKFYKKGPENQINFIRRIEDRFGHVLFEPQVEERELVAPQVALQMREILRKAITHGTGRRARGELYVTLDKGVEAAAEPPKPDANEEEEIKIRIPSFGKTGTTNEHITSYFAGFLPYPVEFGTPLHPKNSYVISSYVGYDDNKVMRRGRQSIYGGSGALPMWTDFAKQIIETKSYKDHLDPLDIKLIAQKEWPLYFDYESSTPFMADLARGLILRKGNREDVEIWKTTDISLTGETFQDLFAPGSSVNSTVYLPMNQNSTPWNAFSPYADTEKTDEIVEDLPLDAEDESQVDLEKDIKLNSVSGKASTEKRSRG